jgi:hypothetical protein
MRPWFSKFSATLHDERWLRGVEDLYLWTDKNQRYLTNRKSSANVGIVYSQQTAWYYGGQQTDGKVEDFALGWYQALVESRVPFDMVHDRLLDAGSLARFKTLILPNIAALSDKQCNELRAFVERGGNLIATYETSLYDENGKQHSNFALADLFGVDWTGKTDARMLNSYIRLEHDAMPKHAIFSGLEDAPRIINGVSQLEVKPREKFAEVPLTLIPSYPDLPMEKVYPRVSKTDISCLYLRQPKGRVAYFPVDIDRTFWEVLNEDHLKVMRNTVRWVSNEEPMLRVIGPGLLDVTVWANSTSVTIHLVNLTNPMAMKGPYRDFFPVGPQSMKLKLPDGLHVRQARLLVSDKSSPIEASGTTVSMTIPSILDHEVVALEL